MEFQYKAMKPNGDIVEGVFIGDSKHDVIEMLKSKNNYPVTVEQKTKEGTKELTIRRGVSSKDLAFFCRQLQAMIYAGSTITKSLDIMKRQLKVGVLKDAVAEMHTDVQKGNVLSASMKNYPKIFPELMIYMVESGEMSGTLDSILVRLAVYFEKDAKLKNKIKSAMVYPIILLVLCVLVVAFLVTFILPTFVSMFETGGIELPQLTKVMIGISSFMRERWLLLLLILIVIALGFYQYINTENGRRRIDDLKLKLPVLKDVNTKILTARFTRNLATMLSSGVPMLTALKNLSDVINNKIVSDAILEYRQKIQQGQEFHVVVKESGLFPPMLDGMIEIGKESGTLDDILDKTADYYDDEVDNALQRLVTLFEPAMILLMAFIVGFIVISMALPMFDMFQTIQ